MPRPTAYGYTRVSTDEQARKGASLAAQQRMIADHYRMVLRPLGYRWGGCIPEPGVSARNRRLFARPGGRRLAELLQPGDVVIVSRIDRIWRRLADFADTMEAWTAVGIHVRALDVGLLDLASAAGYQTAGIGVLMAEVEGLRFGERIKAAHDERRARGKKTNGTVAIGWRATRGKRVVPCRAERDIARRILRWRRAGAEWPQITARLRRDGVRLRGRREIRDTTALRWATAASRGFPLTGYHGCGGQGARL